MNFKKDKVSLLNEIQSKTHSMISSTLSSRIHSDSGPNSVRYAMEEAISVGIREAFRVLIENTYTDQEFEEDLKLRS